MRLIWLTGVLGLALLIAVLSLQSPAPAAATAPATAFSAGRAMADVREIARRPHPVGSPDHARVQALLLQRMTALGLQTSIQTAPMSRAAIARLGVMGGDAPAANFSAANLIGVLPGSDPALPAVALMAHYDTVRKSPGAADDTTGVAAVLEAVRALEARGRRARTLVVLFTDAEELNLDGAHNFWGGHPLRDHIGAVINLEARGGGGRAMMFETGDGNASTIALFSRAGVRATGGVTSNSLAVFVYGLMPNGTDFTVSRERGAQGINLAFIGRPAQYHSPSSTPAALDQGSLQHIGSQALEMSDALLRAPGLPKATANTVYADVFGRVVIRHAPPVGWLLLALAAVLAGFAGWTAWRKAGLDAIDVGRGMIDGLWFLTTAVVLTQAMRVMAGPMAPSSGGYYVLLARLPWMEAGAALAVLAAGLLLIGGRARPDRRWLAGGIAVVGLLALALGGINPVVIGAGVLAVGLSLAPGLAARTVWGGWLGLVALVLVLGVAAQAVAPEAAFLLIWPAVLAAAVAALVAILDPALLGPKSLVPVAVVGVVGAGWLAGMAHPVFLGIGMDLPGVLAAIGLLILILLRPLSPERGFVRVVLVAAAAALIAGAGLSVAARFAEPMARAAQT